MEGCILKKNNFESIFVHCNVRTRVALASTCRALHNALHIEEWANLSHFQRLIKAIEHNEEHFMIKYAEIIRIRHLKRDILYACAKYDRFQYYLKHIVTQFANDEVWLPNVFGFYCAMLKRQEFVEDMCKDRELGFALRCIAGAAASRDPVWLEKVYDMCCSDRLRLDDVHWHIQMALKRIDGDPFVDLKGCRIFKHRSFKILACPRGSPSDIRLGISESYQTMFESGYHSLEDLRDILKQKIDYADNEFTAKTDAFEKEFLKVLPVCSVDDFATYCRPLPVYLIDAYEAGNFAIFQWILNQCKPDPDAVLSWTNLGHRPYWPSNYNVRLRQFVKDEISKVQHLRRARKRARTCGDEPA